MKRAEDQVSGESRANRDVGRFQIANLADHDDIRILPHDVAQPRSKCKPDLGIHMDLVNPVHLILDRIFYRDDLPNGTIDALERTVEGRAFSAPGRTGN